MGGNVNTINAKEIPPINARPKSFFSFFKKRHARPGDVDADDFGFEAEAKVLSK